MPLPRLDSALLEVPQPHCDWVASSNPSASHRPSCKLTSWDFQSLRSNMMRISVLFLFLHAVVGFQMHHMHRSTRTSPFHSLPTREMITSNSLANGVELKFWSFGPLFRVSAHTTINRPANMDAGTFRDDKEVRRELRGAKL